MAKNADEDGNCDRKDHEQPDVVEHSDQLLMGHVQAFYKYLDRCSSSSFKNVDS